MKVLIVTSGDERCGIAEYGKYLIQYLPDVVKTSTATHTMGWEAVCNCAVGDAADIVVFNYEPGLFHWLTPAQVMHLRNIGKKTVLILHTSHEGDNRSDLTRAFDRVVVHEQTSEGFVHIPMGIPIIDVLEDQAFPYTYLGSVGFPFPWKGFEKVAHAANILNFGCHIIAPESHHVNAIEFKNRIKLINPQFRVDTEWFEDYYVVETLADNRVNVFAYEGGNYGISAAVRLGLASKRPLVLSRCRQFRDLFQYDDEIEFIDSTEPVAIVAGVERVLQSGKRPKRVLEDMNWKVVGEKYVNVFEELMK